MTAIKKPVLVKLDRILGHAFFCPHCKAFQCSGKGKCTKCGGEIDWENEQKYEGKVRWK